MAFEKSEDKRRFQRIFYHAGAVLTGPDGPLACKIADLSLRGCLLRFDQAWTAGLGGDYTLSFELSDDAAIKMAVSATHAEDGQVGFKCEHIDIESISYLRRLVELNLGDSELLERDLAALGDFS
ncbi:PilZ domain-containing protein [Methylomonas sp. MED-D]